MLRRHSTKSKSDLQRRKSTNSVRSVQLEHISAATAERDARLAAVHAFSRGHDRHSADMASTFPQKQPSPRQRSNNTPTSQLKRHDSVTSEHEGGGLGRRQSVRFVGPDSALQTRASKISMRMIAPEREQDAVLVATHGSLRRSQSSQKINTERHSVLRDKQNLTLPGRTSSRGKTQATPTSALKQDYLRALIPDHQQYTPEDDVASMPSSYRRIRKTRSMFAAGRGSQDAALFTSDTPRAATPTSAWSRFSFLNKRENDPTPSTPTLKAPKSMGFLRHRKDRPSTSTADQKPAFDYPPILGSLPEQPIRSRILPKSSVFFGAKGHKMAPGMRKTFRNSTSSAVLPESDTTASISPSVHGSMKFKVRKVSSSIKCRFRNLFLNRSEGDSNVPAQQIEAQRTQVADLFDVDHFGPAASDIGRFHARETSSLSRVPARLPDLHSVPSNERLHSRSGSIDSFRSDDRRLSCERSRVTSWASTEANTVNAHRQEDSEEWDRQRLSVITEHGSHAPSPSLRRPKVALQIITSQEELAPSSTCERLAPGTAVDSQRVYLALMKKISDTQQLLDSVRKSSEGSEPFRTLSPPTSDDSSDSDEPAFGCAHPHIDKHSDMHSVLEGFVPERNPARLSMCLEATKGCEKAAGDYRPLSPPVHLTPRGVDKPFTDRSSAFFGSPTSHLFRTRSPWRKCLQETIDKDRSSSQEPTANITDSLGTTRSNNVAEKQTDSVSTYSQDTQIHKLDMRQEHPASGLSEVIQDPGYATMNVDAPTSYRPSGERQVSTASSVDWKKRLSYDMAETERSPPSPTRVTGRQSEVDYVVPTMPRAFGYGHVREPAQIVSYEDDEYNASPAVHIPTSHTTPLGSIEPNVIKLTPQQRSVKQTTPPSASKLQGSELVLNRTSVSLGENGVSYIVPKDALRPRASPLSSGDSRSSPCQSSAQESRPFVRQANSYHTVGRVLAKETGSPRRGSPTVRLMRKTPIKPESTASPGVSTPAFSTVLERHFGSLPKRFGEAKENRSPARKDDDRVGIIGVGAGGQQIKGSKTVVDLFLHNRRRQRRSGEGASFV